MAWRLPRVPSRTLSSAANQALESTTVRPFEDLPSLPRGFPVVGNIHHLFGKPHGQLRAANNFIDIGKKYDPDGIGMVRMESLAMNPGAGKGRALLVYDADIVEQTFR